MGTHIPAILNALDFHRNHLQWYIDRILGCKHAQFDVKTHTDKNKFVDDAIMVLTARALIAKTNKIPDDTRHQVMLDAPTEYMQWLALQTKSDLMAEHEACRRARDMVIVIKEQNSPLV